MDILLHLRRLQASISQWLVPIVRVDNMKFYCPRPVDVWRAYTLYEKEPETLEWIDGFEPNSVFWDIGANVGVYTLYAGVRGHLVYAFEPHAEHFAVLSRNMKANNVPGKSYKVALSTYDVPPSVMRGDDIWGNGAPPADYIKLDVDGPELTILQGAPRVLAHAREVLVEMDGIQDAKIQSLLESSGFTLKWKRQSQMVAKSKHWSSFHNALFVRNS